MIGRARRAINDDLASSITVIAAVTVRDTKNLAAIYVAVERVSAKAPLAGRQLTVLGLEHKPWGRDEITNIKIAKAPELETFQTDLVSALSPYLVKTGDGSAFLTSKTYRRCIRTASHGWDQRCRHGAQDKCPTRSTTDIDHSFRRHIPARQRGHGA